MLVRRILAIHDKPVVIDNQKHYKFNSIEVTGADWGKFIITMFK